VQNKYFILKKRLDPIKQEFDYILIDTPPSLGLLTLGGLCAADEVLIPLQAEYYALEGISQLLNTINLVQKKLNPSLKLMGIFITMYDGRTNLSEQVHEEIKKAFGEKVFKTVIPRSVKLSEAPSFGKPIFLYQPGSVGASSYNDLAKEIIQHG
jgi:chromosome partitioning protein